ncbi:serine hydrolase, partial [Kitasatospora sp. NPDC058406]|uniref:serine hydrolase n=1 Tax=Kitasatospora sp. NPDC058406 TaxID=3346483 RepID=UPI003650D03E
MTIVQARSPYRRRRAGLRLAAVALAGATVVTLAPTAAVAAGASGSATGSAQERRPRVDGQQELRHLVEHGGMTAALAEIRDAGRPLWRGAAGTADLADGPPGRSDGRFRIGSVTKWLVWAVVVPLV